MSHEDNTRLWVLTYLYGGLKARQLKRAISYKLQAAGRKLQALICACLSISAIIGINGKA
ncbi:MAG: hypothetical protein ACK4S0_03795 [Sediminibacterium sp.]